MTFAGKTMLRQLITLPDFRIHIGDGRVGLVEQRKAAAAVRKHFHVRCREEDQGGCPSPLSDVWM
jgi:hypothetical protein